MKSLWRNIRRVGMVGLFLCLWVPGLLIFTMGGYHWAISTALTLLWAFGLWGGFYNTFLRGRIEATEEHIDWLERIQENYLPNGIDRS